MSSINGQESVFEAISDLKEDTGIIKNDIDWIKKSIIEMNNRQTKCNACTNADYIYKQVNTNKEDIEKIQSERNRMIGISIGVSIVISSIFGLFEIGILKYN